MAYFVFLGDMICPVTPAKINTKIKGQNKTLTLINEGEINMLKAPGLTEISFDLLLPNVKYPFAVYDMKKHLVVPNADYYINKIERLKTEKKPFQFIVTRTKPNNQALFDTNIKVSLEDYTIKEDKKEGFDFVVTVKLKQYKEYGTKIYNGTGTLQPVRSTENSPEAKTHPVKPGDTLWNIAKYYYGNGSKYTVIYNANKSIIGGNPNLIYPGQVFTIPDVSGGSGSSSSPGSSVATSDKNNSYSAPKRELRVNFYGVPSYYGNVRVYYTINGKTQIKDSEDSFTLKVDKVTELQIAPVGAYNFFVAFGKTEKEWKKVSSGKWEITVNNTMEIDIYWSNKEFSDEFIEMTKLSPIY